MKLNFDGKKWSLEPVFDFDFLKAEVPLVATLAEHDLRHELNTKLEFLIFNGDLYCNGKSGCMPLKWWFFDNSIRRWSACDDPRLITK